MVIDERKMMLFNIRALYVDYKLGLKWKFRQFWTGLWGGLMVICAVSCVTFMPLGDAMTVLFTAPLSTMIVAAVFLGHRLRLYR